MWSVKEQKSVASCKYYSDSTLAQESIICWCNPTTPALAVLWEIANLRLAVKLQGLAILLKTTNNSETCSCFKLTISNATKGTPHRKTKTAWQQFLCLYGTHYIYIYIYIHLIRIFVVSKMRNPTSHTEALTFTLSHPLWMDGLHQHGVRQEAKSYRADSFSPQRQHFWKHEHSAQSGSIPACCYHTTSE